MKHKRFEENILVDEAYTNYGKVDKNADEKKGQGIAKHFAETLEFEDKKKWYHQIPQEPPSTEKKLTEEQVEELKKEASSALHGDTLAYETKASKSGSSDHQWAKTLLHKGAIGDRVAAATILIQDNPLYHLTALRNLINSVKPAKKKDGIIIIDALSELLISELLIPDTKLRSFSQRPLAQIDEITSGNKQKRRNVLKLWYYEDQLKELYGTYVEALNNFAHDSVEANKEKAVSSMSYLLMHHPEREKMLLTNIINKLGDPTQSVASKVIYHLCQLLYNHPNMKAVVLAEIQKMLFRSNISARAQYYGICFLNQFHLDKDDSQVAENLIKIYFSFFKASIKKGEIDSRLMAAILTGVKRAHPFADSERVAHAQHAQTLHRLVHVAPPAVAIRALALLALVCGGDQHRFYSSLYRKLTTPEMFTTHQSALFINLIYKSLKADKDAARVCAFVKRLLQFCCYLPPAQACGILFLISQVLKDEDKKEAVRLVWTARELKEEEKPKEEKEVISDDEGSDSEVREETHQEEKVEKKVDLLRGDKKDLLDDDEETYVDLDIDDEGKVKQKKRPVQNTAAGWLHVKKEETEDLVKEKDAEQQMKKAIKMDRVVSSYEPLARNPSHAGATLTAYVELCPLALHYHPTVRLFAERLLADQLVQYSGDPLKDFSGIRFLDRFVFKNPKQRAEPQHGDVKKVKGSHPKFAVRKNYSARGLKSLPVTSASYLNEDAKKIPVDERFLYDFLQKRKAQSDDESDDDSVTSEDFERYLDSVTGSKEAAADSDEEVDYLAEMEATKAKRPKSKKADSDEELVGDDDDEDDDGGADEDFDENDDDEGSDGELNISDEDGAQLSGEEDELLLEGSGDDDDDDLEPGKRGKDKMKLKLKGKDDLGSLFASAEEFSTLLEETASNKKQGSSQAVANTDNSSVKQLAWEEKRDRWIKGFNKKMHGGKGGRKNKFNKKSGNKMAAQNGGKRKGGTLDGPGRKRKK